MRKFIVRYNVNCMSRRIVREHVIYNKPHPLRPVHFTSIYIREWFLVSQILRINLIPILLVQVSAVDKNSMYLDFHKATHHSVCGSAHYKESFILHML